MSPADPPSTQTKFRGMSPEDRIERCLVTLGRQPVGKDRQGRAGQGVERGSDASVDRLADPTGTGRGSAARSLSRAACGVARADVGIRLFGGEGEHDRHRWSIRHRRSALRRSATRRSQSVALAQPLSMTSASGAASGEQFSRGLKIGSASARMMAARPSACAAASATTGFVRCFLAFQDRRQNLQRREDFGLRLRRRQPQQPPDDRQRDQPPQDRRKAEGEAEASSCAALPRIAKVFGSHRQVNARPALRRPDGRCD